jgi:hypothetical protein
MGITAAKTGLVADAKILKGVFDILGGTANQVGAEAHQFFPLTQRENGFVQEFFGAGLSSMGIPFWLMRLICGLDLRICSIIASNSVVFQILRGIKPRKREQDNNFGVSQIACPDL